MLHQEFEENRILFQDKNKTVLTMTENETDSGIQIKLEGELTRDTANGLLDELDALICVGVSLDVDFSKVTYITPAVMNSFLVIQQKIDRTGKGGLILRGLPALILDEFDRVGMTDLLEIVE